MADKTSKWVKKNGKGNITALRPKEQPAVPKSAVPGDEKQPVAVEELVRPEPSDYYAFDSEGNPKEDGRRRVMVMLEPDGTTIAPVIWFGTNFLEVSVLLAEAARIMAMECATKYIQRESDIENEVQNRLLAVVRSVQTQGTEESDV